VCLLIVRRVFKDQVPTVADYAQGQGISTDTIRRAARALLWPVARLLWGRRPGPRRTESTQATRQACELDALEAVNDLLKSLLSKPVAALLQSPRIRGLVIQQVLYWQTKRVALARLAQWLGLCPRTLTRWIERFHERGGHEEVPHDTRRPHSSPRRLPTEIQEALWRLRQAFEDRSIAELAKVFNEKCQHLLTAHGLGPICAKTAGKYLNGSRPPPAEPGKPDSETSERSPRGGYQYPPVLTMAWIDTTYLNVAGTTVHIVGAMEAASRIAVAADVFVQENAETTAAVLAQTLARVPELAAVLRDRGTPYLNERINLLLAERQILPINAHPHFPLDKAGLERWWDTVKAWIRHAIKPFVQQCANQGRSPTAVEVVEIVRAALRVFLRAYNLLPQPYLEGKSPIERIEALLRGESNGGFSLGDLRQAARERETKDDLLQQLRDAFRLDVPLAKLRLTFVNISRQALEQAIRALGVQTAAKGQGSIRNPIAYLLVVARAMEQEVQEMLARRRSERHKHRCRKADEARRMEVLTKEQQLRVQHPDQVLPDDISRWILTFRDKIPAVGRRSARLLAESLRALAVRIGAAFGAQVRLIRRQLPARILQLRPDSAHLIDALTAQFDQLATGLHHAGPAGPDGASGPLMADTS
jgi:transposase InsO family protein